MSWSEDMADGVREQINDGAGAILTFRGKQIPIILNSGIGFWIVVNGGEADSNNSSFSVLRSDLAREVGSFKPKQGNAVKINGVELKVKSTTDDPAFPTIQVFVIGPEQ